VSPYGAAKSVLEAAVTAQPLSHGVRVIWARAFNHVGPGQGLDAPVAQWCKQIAAAERQGGGVLRTGRLDVVRDFLDVRDIADAYIALVQSDTTGVINVCSGSGTSLQAVAKILIDEARVAISLERVPELERSTDPSEVVGDPSHLHAATSWAPRVSLRESLRDVLDEWRGRDTDKPALEDAVAQGSR
jgi:GDP-4-dehydro-6-deoxy-D-mannose reductase